MKKNIWITGKQGQLASEIFDISCNSLGNFYFTSLKEVDITNKKKVDDYIRSNKINLIVNCAAFTDVDGAETNEKQAYEVNAYGVKNILDSSFKYNCKLIHISTDYVFGSLNKKEINELNEMNPLNIYGKSKLMGEKFILQSKVNSVIIRTSWLYSNYGKNFLKKIIELSISKKNITVIDDQIGTPTNANNLAKVCLKFIETSDFNIINREIYNYSDGGSCSWYEFACEIKNQLGFKAQIYPISTLEFNQLAKRPNYSVLDKSKIKSKLDIKIINWKKSLKHFFLNNIL